MEREEEFRIGVWLFILLSLLVSTFFLFARDVSPPLLVPLPSEAGDERGSAKITHLLVSGQYTLPPTGVVGTATTPRLVL